MVPGNPVLVNNLNDQNPAQMQVQILPPYQNRHSSMQYNYGSIDSSLYNEGNQRIVNQNGVEANQKFYPTVVRIPPSPNEI